MACLEKYKTRKGDKLSHATLHNFILQGLALRWDCIELNDTVLKFLSVNCASLNSGNH